MEQEVKKKKKKITEDNVAKSVNKKPEVKKHKKKKNSPVIPVLCLIIGILLGVIASMMFLDKDIVKDTEKAVENNVGEEAADTKGTVDEMLEEDSFTIETPIVDLYYPLKWQDQLRVEQIEGDTHVVKFFGTVEGKEEQHLFDVVFGATEGISVGTLDEKEVYLIYGDFTPGEGWNDEEADTIYTMQEDVNYLLGMLQQEDGFVPAE